MTGGAPTRLLAVVHTEEEFDWRAPFSRDARATTHLAELDRAQTVFERHGLKPLYVVDDPVARDPAGVAKLAGWRDAGRAVIGAHLHPWVSPPFEEPLGPYWSYPGNLPAALEEAKLAQLTALIEAAFGERPRHYVAGRYGFGPNTAGILAHLGYAVDLSPSPAYDFTADGGPDYDGYGLAPRQLGAVLQIPHTSAHTGALARSRGGRRLARQSGVLGHTLRRAMARAGVYRRLRLSPEGADLAALRTLTRHALAERQPFLVLSFHSPSIVPGFTPYVRTAADLDRFLETLDRYIAWALRTGRVEAGDPEGVVSGFPASRSRPDDHPTL
jgi:hypothetical protein